MPFSATYVTAGRRESRASAGPQPAQLQSILQSYVCSEYLRTLAVRQRLARCRYVGVFGIRDNFFRSFAMGGPLKRIPIFSIIDERHSSLSQTSYADTYRLLSVDDCCTEFPDSTCVDAVSCRVPERSAKRFIIVAFSTFFSFN